MKQQDFQKLLLETVICSIACDGDIDDREVAELHKMVSHAQYFKGFNGHVSLEDMVQSVKSDGRSFLKAYFELLENTDLSPVQELLVLEVVLRIIQADGRLDDNEITFLKLVRSSFSVHDQIITQRFGNVPYLTSGSSEQFVSSASHDMAAIADKIELTADEDKNFSGLFCTFVQQIRELKINENEE